MIRYFAVVILVITTASFAQADNAPWAFDASTSTNDTSPSPGEGHLDADVLRVLIQAYKNNETKTSVRRCLFDVTCSRFAQLAVDKHGLVIGGVMFIDRYFYRENNDSRLFYPLESEHDGTFRLNDSPFVP